MQYKKYTAPTRKETPLDENLRKAFGELIDPGMYVVEMTDRSMSPFIAKGSILVMEEEQAIGEIVDVVCHYKGESNRYIRRCVKGEKENHWIFSPLNLNGNYPSFTSNPYNIKDTQIIGSLRFFLNFGSRRSKNRQIKKLIEAGDIRNLLKISEFNKNTRVRKVEL